MEHASNLDLNGDPVLIGICGVRELPLQGMPQEVGVPDALGIYINAIGLDLDFQGHYVESERERRSLGTVLLDMSLAVAAHPSMLPNLDKTSYAWALVLEGNDDSSRMFKHSGFEKHPPLKPGGQGVMYRPGAMRDSDEAGTERESDVDQSH
jgi:hypothetical protein